MINSSLPSVPATHGTFSGHETFVFRYGWLKKGLDLKVGAVSPDQLQ